MIDVSTACASPVRRRCHNAWITPIADRYPLPVSPSEVRLQNGVPPSCPPPSS